MQKSAWDDAWGFTQAPALAGCVEDLEEAEALRSACAENEEPNCDAIELVQLGDQAAASESEGDEEEPVAHITQLYDAHDAAQSEDEEEAEEEPEAEEQAQAQWCGAGWVQRSLKARL